MFNLSDGASLGLAGLFLSAFLSATLLPGSSEAFLFALLRMHPEQAMLALVTATAANTLGGLTTYGIARALPQRFQEKLTPQRLATVRHWGPISLVLAWAPVIGDALCAAAGWLRLPIVACTLWMALGKGLRYAFVAWGASVL
jgi:membrane protein YqaA with SNARE-associated domain